MGATAACMGSPPLGVPRAVRAASFGVVGFVPALAAHVAAGGAAPAPVETLLLAGLVGLVAVVLTGAKPSPVRVGVSLAAMQLILHEVFSRLDAPVGCSMAGVSVPIDHMGGHGGGPLRLIECATGIAHVGMGQDSAIVPAAMFGAHVVATAAAVVILAYGENVLWLLARCVRPLKGLSFGLPERPKPRIVYRGVPRTLGLRLACGGVGRRGPPPRGVFAIA